MNVQDDLTRKCKMYDYSNKAKIRLTHIPNITRVKADWTTMQEFGYTLFM